MYGIKERTLRYDQEAILQMINEELKDSGESAETKLQKANAMLRFLKLMDDSEAAHDITGKILGHYGEPTEEDHTALVAEIKRQLFGIAG
jgi:hypothetical protein